MWIERSCASLCGLALLVGITLACFPISALALHYDRGEYVTAMKPCLPGEANTQTSEGIPACSPPLRLSDCSTDPATARRLGVTGLADYIVKPSGRIMTRHLGQVLDIDARLRISQIETCNGAGVPDNIIAPMVLRMTLDDPLCAGKICTLPDFVVPVPAACRGKRCRAKHRGAGALFEAAGFPRVPSSFPWTAEMLSLNVVDPAGHPVLSQGVRLGKGLPRPGFPRQASRWEARVVRAYQPCLPSATDTTTSNGRAACANPRPLSDCSTDPLNAIGAERLAKGKLTVKARSGRKMTLGGRFKGLRTCSGEPYSGTARLVITMRVTVEDPACADWFCTAVDIEAGTDIEVSRGVGLFQKHTLTGVPEGIGTFANLEILRAEVRDRAGKAVLAGHGMLVRCDKRPNGPFCFGN